MIMPKQPTLSYHSCLCSFDCYKLITAIKQSLKWKQKCQEPN